MASDALASVAVFSVSAAVTCLPQFLPKLWEVHHASSNSEFAVDVRVGEVVVFAFFAAIGVIAASIAGSKDPLLAALVMGVFIVGAYESALQNDFNGVRFVV